MRRIVKVLLRSALRLSQPLSGLIASSRYVALFRAAAVPEVLSFRAFPSRRSRTPLEAAGSLAVIPDPLGCAFQSLVSAGFTSDAPRERVTPLVSPNTYGVPFNALTRSPGSPGLQTTNSTSNINSPTSKLFSLRESVHFSPSFPRREGRCSPGLRPL